MFCIKVVFRNIMNFQNWCLKRDVFIIGMHKITF